MTSARVALFFCRTTDLQNQEAKNLLNLKRHLYCRMLQEHESRENVEELLKSEWGEDRDSNVCGRVDEWLGDHLTEHVSSGRYPRTNLSLDLDAQWEDVWQEPRITATNNSMCQFMIYGKHLSSSFVFCSQGFVYKFIFLVVYVLGLWNVQRETSYTTAEKFISQQQSQKGVIHIKMSPKPNSNGESSFLQ